MANDTSIDSEGFVTRDGVRLINPFDGNPVTQEQLDGARDAKQFYTVNAATFVMNMLDEDGPAIAEMLDDEELQPVGLLGGLGLMFVEILQGLGLGDDIPQILWSYIESQAPGLTEDVFKAAASDLIEEGVPEEEVAAAIEHVKEELTGG